ncbi:hypothetical protein [Novosphingobium beihaiensis]|uniref:Uncharacterized protein n=1 Tax=Novosphingobium beihaiensis TaxID=2930389 RepID=A0ABT0BTU4_9SPHN|nr:hypothetical protein [Novosphingobium beihaiensis]MCJ2188473.1 hypothetical protein [Novosphingobium beihaiensis]
MLRYRKHTGIPALAFAGLAVLALPTAAQARGQAQSSGCAAEPVIDTKTSLTDLSDIWFGDGSFRYAIMLATNARSGTGTFAFIGDPNQLKPGAKVCIPHSGEAERMRRRYNRYLTAVQDMSLAEPWEEVNTLDPLPKSGTYRVATWIRADQVSRYPSSPSSGFNYAVGGDTWVTLEPHLKAFCKDYVRTVSDNPAALTLRLEERLGLPPVSAKAYFAVLEIDAASSSGGKKVFRPCAVPATDTTSCAAGTPTANQPFFYQQYYDSYGTAMPAEYPWTSLGYTFDWAPQPATLSKLMEYVRVGESEYVVPKGTMAKFIGTYSTAQYCAP